MPTETYPRLQIRWMIRYDLEGVLAVEAESFSNPWSEADFLKVLQQRRMIPIVAEVMDGRPDRIAGFLIYQLCKGHLDIQNLAVALTWRRQGIGTALVNFLRYKLTADDHAGQVIPGPRHSIVADVRETNLPSQLFFRSVGFRCNTVLRAANADNGEDTYRFAWRLGGLNEWDSSIGGTQDVETACRVD